MENRDLHPGFLNPSYPVVMCSLETHVKTGTQWRETDWSGKAAVAAPRTYELAMTWFHFVLSIDWFSSFKPETKPEAPGWLPTLDLSLNSGKSSEVLVEGTEGGWAQDEL